ncbi:orotate phosphoribosyltransferase [Streptomyces aidingensis]|uniref:Orotate phosphoribosyltransferase n=1 Tax=Streptomyces aidingensis TaxID=910347 RepID=A0A1I1SM83_9ACTN|nr:phosphoribosyltransferase family protein [Streptomyces aidingensis]SFD47511.1 orotate phosphoribosyltransferase [Streptomyces aidingensis]
MNDSGTRDLAARIYQHAHLTGDFVLSTGERSTEYFDCYTWQGDPALLREVAERMTALLPADTEVITGPDLGGVPLTVLLAQITGLPAAFVRKQARDYGTCKIIEGAEVAGRRVVAVEPAIKTGRFIMGTCTELRGAGAEVNRVVCAVDREHGAPERLAAKGLDFGALFTMGDLARAR